MEQDFTTLDLIMTDEAKRFGPSTSYSLERHKKSRRRFVSGIHSFPSTEYNGLLRLFASKHNLEVAIEGGGHSCSGAASSEDVIVDLANINSGSRGQKARCRWWRSPMG